MYCTHCGSLAASGATFCAKCGHPLGRAAAARPPLAGAPATGSPTSSVSSATAPVGGGAVASPLAPSFVVFSGFWRRVGARLLDELLITIGVIIVVIIPAIMFAAMKEAGSITEDEYNLWVNLIYYGVTIPASWLYHALMESSANQATLGKMALAIRVTTTAGERMSFANATGRFFAKFLSGLICGFGFLMMLWTDRRQTLHDQLANTVVVLRDQPVA